MLKRCVLFVALALGACSSVTAPPGLEAGRPVGRADLVDGLSAWARVLKNRVDDRGRVDFAGLAADPQDTADLNRFVGLVWHVSPTSHPELFSDAEERLGWLIDAYNALALYTVIENGIPTDLSSLTKRIDFFVLNRIMVGGEEMSLRGFENEVIRKLGEPRIHFALNCMAAACPVLPQVPFSGPDLTERLEREAVAFFAETRNFEIDDAGKRVVLSQIIEFFPEDFEEVAGSVRAYVARYRDVPEGYALAYRPYDWTINAQP